MSHTLDECRDEARHLVDWLYRQADSYQAGLVPTTPLPMLGAELVQWHRVADGHLPDEDESVILHLDTPIDPCIEGLWTDGAWHSIDGTRIRTPVLHWARIAGPAPEQATAPTVEEAAA